MTRQPFARRSCAVSWPRMPEADDDERLAERRRGAAHALERDGAERHGARLGACPGRPGCGTTRLRGTRMTSAWCAHCAPAQATRSPTSQVVDALADLDDDAGRRVAGRPRPPPVAPLDELPCRAEPLGRRHVDDPLDLAGWRIALFHSGVALDWMPLSSVPTEMQECSTRTRTGPRSTTGAGTSSTPTWPLAGSMTCLMLACVPGLLRWSISRTSRHPGAAPVGVAWSWARSCSRCRRRGQPARRPGPSRSPGAVSRPRPHRPSRCSRSRSTTVARRRRHRGSAATCGSW